MNSRRQQTMSMPLEVLEGRVVLTAAAHPVHALAAGHGAHVEVAKPHVAAEKVTAVANPVLVNLTPLTTGITITSVTYDPRIHLISVKGTLMLNTSNVNSYYPYTSPYPTIQYLGVNATQAISRSASVSGSQYLSIPVANAAVTTVSFNEHVLADSGTFAKGVVNLTVNSSDSYGGYTTLNVLARMRTAKAY